MKKKQAQNQRRRGLQTLLIFLLVIASFSFFGANFLNSHFLNYFTFFPCFIAIALSVPFLFKKGEFNPAVQLIALSVVMSVFMAYFSWGQSFKDSIIVTVPLLLWVFYFYLLHIKFPVRILESIVIFYAFVYVILYFFQFLNPDTIFFGVPKGEAFYKERGIFRIVFPGGGIFFLAVFIALNKLNTQKTGKPIWILLIILGVIIPIMQATRQFIAGIIIIYVYHFIKEETAKKKALIIAAVVGFLILIGNSNIPVIEGLLAAQEKTVESGSEDPRVISGTYFLTEFSPNILSNVLGNGVPAAPDQSRYGKYIESLYPKDLFMEDVGIIGLFTRYGILAVIGYIMIWVKSFQLSLPKEYSYPKYYLWFLVVTCLTSDTVFSNYYLISTVVALYIYQAIYNEKNPKNEEAKASRLKYEYRKFR
jgi:hypothetical protein